MNNKYDKTDIDIISEAYDECCMGKKCTYKSEDSEDKDLFLQYDEIIDRIANKCLSLIKKELVILNIRDSEKLEDAIYEIGNRIGDRIKEFTMDFSDNIHSDYKTGDDEMYDYYMNEDEETEVEENASENEDIEEDSSDDDMNDIPEDEEGPRYGRKSFLDDSIQRIYDAKTFDEAAAFFRDLTKTANIYPGIKRKILNEIDNLERRGKNLTRLQTYATDSMFKWKNMGLK